MLTHATKSGELHTAPANQKASTVPKILIPMDPTMISVQSPLKMIRMLLYQKSTRKQPARFAIHSVRVHVGSIGVRRNDVGKKAMLIHAYRIQLHSSIVPCIIAIYMY